MNQRGEPAPGEELADDEIVDDDLVDEVAGQDVDDVESEVTAADDTGMVANEILIVRTEMDEAAAEGAEETA